MSPEQAASADGAETHRLVLRRDLAEMTRVARFVDDVVQRAGWRKALVFPLQLCLEEAVSNVIRHGVVRRGDPAIRVALADHGGRVVASVEDDGEAFDPTAIPPQPIAPSLADCPTGGFGVGLMRRFAVRIAYARVGASNRLVFEFGSGV
ncbi:MAG TPA: ATP-binding protein [Stellaceae bacterium]|nr:ATP-binding protein [Stellaceae bacterium]